MGGASCPAGWNVHPVSLPTWHLSRSAHDYGPVLQPPVGNCSPRLAGCLRQCRRPQVPGCPCRLAVVESPGPAARGASAAAGLAACPGAGPPAVTHPCCRPAAIRADNAKRVCPAGRAAASAGLPQAASQRSWKICTRWKESTRRACESSIRCEVSTLRLRCRCGMPGRTGAYGAAWRAATGRPAANQPARRRWAPLSRTTETPRGDMQLQSERKRAPRDQPHGASPAGARRRLEPQVDRMTGASRD